MYKLEKEIKLFKHEFDKFLMEMYKEMKLERESIILDGILFRIKYMLKNNLDLNKIPELKEKFTKQALLVKEIFEEFIIHFLSTAVGFGNEFSINNIVDVISLDVKIDNTNVEFKTMIISNDIKYLAYIDNQIPEDKEFRIYPNEFFRFYSDSYNDAIAKAFPELFENRHQDVIGVGADGDVFVHSFTFQTSESCNLRCTYCVGENTPILMSDLTEKPIKDVKVGDKVVAFKEELDISEEQVMKVAEVTKTMNREAHDTYLISSHITDEGMYITGEHPILDSKLNWKPVRELSSHCNVMTTCKNVDNYYDAFRSTAVVIQELRKKMRVYNLETTLSTYIANKILVHNCYQFNKSPMNMEFDTAKLFIDRLLNDEYGYINRYNSPAIILEFIGGEPLLEIKLTRQIYEYFLRRTYELDHPWFTMHRVSICSNGLSYFDEEVQSFFKEYSANISFNISIDGNKELHDACRIQPNGEGSYNIAMNALNHYNRTYSPERNSKMTLAPQNMKYLYDSVINFINNDMKIININCIFEEGWNQETALLEYNELKRIADYILENNLENIYLAIFTERQEDVQDPANDGNFCGGLGSMLSLRPNGQFYPCIRYMPSSVGNDVTDLCIGTVKDGMIGRSDDSPVLNMMDAVTRRSQMNDVCYDCPIGNQCAHCSALGHTVYGTPEKRTSFICIQKIAEALANVYYWNLNLIKNPQYDLEVRKNNVPEEWALLVIDKDELKYLKMIETYAQFVYLDKKGLLKI